MQYRSTNPKGKAQGMSASILHTKRGLVNNYFLAHCFHGYNKHVFSPQELYECLPWSSGTVDMSPTRRDCITYTAVLSPENFRRRVVGS